MNPFNGQGQSLAARCRWQAPGRAIPPPAPEPQDGDLLAWLQVFDAWRATERVANQTRMRNTGAKDH